MSVVSGSAVAGAVESVARDETTTGSGVAVGTAVGSGGSGFEEDYKESSGYNEYMDDKAEAQKDQDAADADYDEERRKYWENKDDGEWHGG